MANLKQIKTKIKSVGNLKKITRALEVVSTVKLQKVKTQADGLKEYLVDLLAILSNVNESYSLFEESLDSSWSSKELAIIITSERGLCGWLNSKILRKVYNEKKWAIENTDFFVVGKKGLEFIKRMWGNIVWSLSVSDKFEEKELLPLYTYFEKATQGSEYGKVTLYFNYFRNSMVQTPTNVQLFPFAKEDFDRFLKEIEIDYTFNSDIGQKDLMLEPSLEEFMDEAKRQIRNYLISSAIVQNKAWEHAARMIAMKNAKDNANSFVKSLTLTYNKARQWAITQEISEIVSAKIAIGG